MQEYNKALDFLLEHGYIKKPCIQELLAYIYQKDIRVVAKDAKDKAYIHPVERYAANRWRNP